MQIILEFDHVFWTDKLEEKSQYFGATLDENSADRGLAATVWNFHPFVGVPILAALVTGTSAVDAASMSETDLKVCCSCSSVIPSFWFIPWL